MKLKSLAKVALLTTISLVAVLVVHTQLLAQAVGNLQVLTPDSGIVQNRMVFSTVNEEVRPPKILTIRNTGTGRLTITGLSLGDSQERSRVRIADHQRAGDFRLVNAPRPPIDLGANASINLSVQFAPQRAARIIDATTHTQNGENYASLTITSNDPDEPTRRVNLAGVNFANYESINEPSIAEISRIFGWKVGIGTENLRLGSRKTLSSDEVYSPYWVRADTTKPVLLWPLGVTSGRGRRNTPHGGIRFEAKPGSGGNSGFIYEFASRDNDDSPTGTEVPGSNDLTGGENQKLLPKILVNGVNRVPTTNTVDFTPTTAFALNNGGSWTDDNKNGTYKLRNWRTYHVRNAQGTIIPNIWYAAQDIGLDPDPSTYKNFDYNDHIYLLVNANPE